MNTPTQDTNLTTAPPASAPPEGPPPAEIMMRMLTAPMITRAINVAAKLGIADLVHGQPRTAEQLAEATGTHAPSLYRVLRALASVGIFAEDAEGRFGLTPLAGLLRSDVPGSLRGAALFFFGIKVHWDAWGDIMHSVQTGGTTIEHLYGVGPFEYFTQHPEEAEVFNNAMTSISQAVSAAVGEAYDFTPFTTLVDVAGGHGGLLAAILEANPHLQGILFDLPFVIEGARELIAARGLEQRCQLVGGDFFESVPSGDGYILKNIIHDWDDEKAAAILRNIHRAMAPDGARKLLLVEFVLAPRNEPSMGKLIDLEMLLLPGGRERTEEEYRSLLASAGFELTRIVPTRSPMCIIEGVPV
ncbi:MAG: acetylserotonin O-methyltransferase [Armatimonadota bacterium]|nr:acetylserotonin O-methyltransferase [Armatimonadota bacterium]